MCMHNVNKYGTADIYLSTLNMEHWDEWVDIQKLNISGVSTLLQLK